MLNVGRIGWCGVKKVFLLKEYLSFSFQAAKEENVEWSQSQRDEERKFLFTENSVNSS